MCRFFHVALKSFYIVSAGKFIILFVLIPIEVQGAAYVKVIIVPRNHLDYYSYLEAHINKITFWKLLQLQLLG